MNRRQLITMTPDEVEAFIETQRTMTMCSLAPDGSVHAVAMWFGFLDGCIASSTKAKSQKVMNLRRDPRLTLLFEDGETYETLRGVELVGRAEIVEDPDSLWRLGVTLFERNQAPYSEDLAPVVEAMLRKRVGITFHVEKTVSWDHRKLSGP
jgi:PPOX class probable F420-dependent enzyme